MNELKRYLEARHGAYWSEHNTAEVLQMVEEKWEPIDTAPRDASKILASSPDSYNVYIIQWSITGKFWVHESLGRINDLTHWQMLPVPPKEPK